MKQTEKNQQGKSRTALKMFCEFMSKQHKIVGASDMIPGMLYTHVTSTNGMDVDRCILWHGAVDKDFPMLNMISAEYDAQLNIEIQPFNGDSVFVYIAQHKLGYMLDDIDSWVWE